MSIMLRLAQTRLDQTDLLSSHPNITAFHIMMLFSDGAPLTPAGGSSWSLGDHHITLNHTVYFSVSIT